MRHREAVALLEGAVPREPGTWADLGAGDGTFARAIAEMAGPGSRIYAVDRDGSALEGVTPVSGVDIVPVTEDFTEPFDLPGLGSAKLDGILLANALHYVPDPAPVLGRLVSRLRPGGRLVLVEYDRRGPNRWVPYPIPSAHWTQLAASAGLVKAAITRSRPSAFGGALYVAVAERPASPAPR